jgi:hypothetical protein
MTDHRENIRIQFRPKKITTLFIGESVPNNGGFFYDGSNALLSHFKSVIESEFGKTDAFLATFKSYGWFLDDLAMEPVDHLEHGLRTQKLKDSVPGLAKRIREYEPQAVVCFLKRIDGFVRAAIDQSGIILLYEYRSLPFPGNGQQTRFKDQFKEIVGNLPKL